MRTSFFTDPFHFPLLIAKLNLLPEPYCLCSKVISVASGESLGISLANKEATVEDLTYQDYMQTSVKVLLFAMGLRKEI